MRIKDDFLLYFTKTSRGTFLVASNEEPFFCFEGETQEEVEKIAVRALALYESARERPVTESKSLSYSETPHFIISEIKKKAELEHQE
jgi:predicted RNase H-like HicB family nuclease